MTELGERTTAHRSRSGSGRVDDVNGRACRVRCEDRHLLVEVLREQLRLRAPTPDA